MGCPILALTYFEMGRLPGNRWFERNATACQLAMTAEAKSLPNQEPVPGVVSWVHSQNIYSELGQKGTSTQIETLLNPRGNTYSGTQYCS